MPSLPEIAIVGVHEKSMLMLQRRVAESSKDCQCFHLYSRKLKAVGLRFICYSTDIVWP